MSAGESKMIMYLDDHDLLMCLIINQFHSCVSFPFNIDAFCRRIVIVMVCVCVCAVAYDNHLVHQKAAFKVCVLHVSLADDIIVE